MYDQVEFGRVYERVGTYALGEIVFVWTLEKKNAPLNVGLFVFDKIIGCFNKGAIGQRLIYATF